MYASREEEDAADAKLQVSYNRVRDRETIEELQKRLAAVKDQRDAAGFRHAAPAPAAPAVEAAPVQIMIEGDG